MSCYFLDSIFITKNELSKLFAFYFFESYSSHLYPNILEATVL